MLNLFFEALVIGITGIVFTEVLMSPEMLLEKYAQLIEKLPQWLYFPLGGCIFCFTGQLALWTYLIMHWHSYSLFDHVATVMIAIFTSLIYKNVWK